MKSKLPIEPKDLGVKIGTPDEVFWTELKGKMEEAILAAKREILVDEQVLAFTKEKIAEEINKGKI